MKEKLILIGGGGHCKSSIDVIEAEGKYKIAGIVDVKARVGESVCGYRIIGTDQDLPKMIREYRNFLITLGHIKSPRLRVQKFDFLKNANVKMPAIVAPDAYVSNYATVGEGTIVMHQAVINAQARVGHNCIINTGALVEHDSVVENHCHVSTHAVINGECHLGQETFLGSNSTLNNNVKVPAGCLIASGSLVRKSIKTSGWYAGNPARMIRKDRKSEIRKSKSETNPKLEYRNSKH